MGSSGSLGYHKPSLRKLASPLAGAARHLRKRVGIIHSQEKRLGNDNPLVVNSVQGAAVRCRRWILSPASTGKKRLWDLLSLPCFTWCVFGCGLDSTILHGRCHFSPS